MQSNVGSMIEFNGKDILNIFRVFSLVTVYDAILALLNRLIISKLDLNSLKLNT